MTERFLRSVRVTIGDGDSALKVERLFIRFQLRREATATPVEGHVDVFNLNESNETRVREAGLRIQVDAGYGDDLSRILDGSVRRVERVREGLDRVTRVHVGGKKGKGAKAGPAFMRAYEGDVTVRTIVADGVAVLGLELGSLDPIPEDEVETNYRYNGPARDMLTTLLYERGIEWYNDDGVARFSGPGKTLDDRPDGVTISERTGMLGTPTVTEDGIRVKSLLNAKLRLDTKFRVVSAVLDNAASGDATNQRAAEVEGAFWKVVFVEHEGDNRGGGFMTLVEGRPIE